jgi:hypothetical protein
MKARLFFHVAQAKGAQMGAACVYTAALGSLFWKGPGPALVLVLFGLFLGHAAPGPTDELDSHTDRR